MTKSSTGTRVSNSSNVERYKTTKEAALEINLLLKEKRFNKYELTKEERDKYNKILNDLNNQPIQFLNVWNTNRVIDFINWYVDLKGLGENNKLENQCIINSFLRDDKVEVWKEVQKFKSNYIFELDKIEEENLTNYLNKLKKKYGSYGFLTYKFTPTGIGTVIKVKSSHQKKSKEITNLSSW